ncbi:MAG: 6-phosphogluconolactonase [Thiobacillus sp.]
MSLPKKMVFAEAGALVTALADAVRAEAGRAIEARGMFHLVLAGGSTPIALYRELAAGHAGDSRWHIWYGDERCLPPDHPQRNSVMAEAAWLSGAAIPPGNRLPIPAERGAEAAAADYAAMLATVPSFDLVLLGMGEDGHTASLFPGHDWGTAPSSPAVLAVHDAPKPPPDRVSLSAVRLCGSRSVWFIVSGEGKSDAVKRWRNGEALPVTAIHGRNETLAWLDQSAWGMSFSG